MSATKATFVAGPRSYLVVGMGIPGHWLLPTFEVRNQANEIGDWEWVSQNYPKLTG